MNREIRIYVGNLSGKINYHECSISMVIYMAAKYYDLGEIRCWINRYQKKIYMILN